MANDHASQLTYSRVLKRFYTKLAKALPMNDNEFVTRLYLNGVLSDNLYNQLKSLHRTSTEKADHFLDFVIHRTNTLVMVVLINS